MRSLVWEQSSKSCQAKTLRGLIDFLRIIFVSTIYLFLNVFSDSTFRKDLVCIVILVRLFCELSPKTGNNFQNFYKWKHYGVG